ncbi:MAG TPA: exopolysaccharide biosynthesis polyprenyl glycosylphosphotransferase [Verrucomicrobiae bacterium]|jgi:exopolysaccharide biosynthesis polyprenyl glycosylphosphotransferase|nr:exopolysaccharide biosynthesis polyprenyl glycosylphosphotransferase [Verrucomicrobiae bacterium]
MVGHRSIGVRALASFWQLVAVTISFWGWVLVWQGEAFYNYDMLRSYLVYNEFLLVGILFGLGKSRENHGLDHEWVVANRRSIRQTFLGLFSVFLALFVAHDNSASRSFFLSYIPWLYLTLLFSNYLLPRSLSKISFSGDREERVALVGTAGQSQRLKSWLENKRTVGFRTLGLVCPESTSTTNNLFPVLGSLEKLDEIIREHAITQLIVLELSLGSQRLQQVTQLCEESGVRLLALHDLDDYFNHRTTTFEDDGVRFIGLRDEPLESPLNRSFKRMLDVAVAVPVVILILPFTTLLVWFLQRLQSPGPIFFQQTRAGMRGRPFTIYKYRTMHVTEANEVRQASKGDPRVFPSGHWLRKLSIDELPQFVNVLRGNMSVVGPRPHLPKHEEIFMQAMKRYLIRKFICPGITGWAQVNGLRGEIHTESDIQRRVEADIFYLENWSLSLDCLVILKTIKHCILPPRSAY